MSIEDILFNKTLYTYKPQSRFKQPKRCTSELYTVVFVSDKCLYEFKNIGESGLNDEDDNLIVVCRNLVIENIMFSNSLFELPQQVYSYNSNKKFNIKFKSTESTTTTTTTQPVKINIAIAFNIYKKLSE